MSSFILSPFTLPFVSINIAPALNSLLQSHVPFERELDYYLITANTDCITATERIIDKSIALASRVDKAKRDFEAAKSEHEIFLIALECCNQFCQGSGGIVTIPTEHKLYKECLILRKSSFPSSLASILI